MANNTRFTGAAIPEELEAAARRGTGYPDVGLSQLVRAGLRMLTDCDPGDARRVIAESYLKTGPKPKTR